MFYFFVFSILSISNERILEDNFACWEESEMKSQKRKPELASMVFQKKKKKKKKRIEGGQQNTNNNILVGRLQ